MYAAIVKAVSVVSDAIAVSERFFITLCILNELLNVFVSCFNPAVFVDL